MRARARVPAGGTQARSPASEAQAPYAAYGSPVFRDVTDTPFGPGVPVAVARNDYSDPTTATGPIVSSLRTTGLDGGGNALLSATRGYDDVTGLGSLWLGVPRSLRAG